jgi:GH24 family phage-related lysozyme (muramidase)
MSSFRIPGSLCASNAPPIDDGTLVRACMPPPGPMCLAGAAPVSRDWHNYSLPSGFLAATLTMSPEAIALLQAIEVLRLKPYDDQTGQEITDWVAGATIGYGHLIDSAEWTTYASGIDEAQASALFKADAAPFERTVGDIITVGLQQHEFDALVLLAFNIGKTGFRNSSVARLVNQVDTTPGKTALEMAWKAWNKSQGKVSPGLVNRRAAEWRIYTIGIYARW